MERSRHELVEAVESGQATVIRSADRRPDMNAPSKPGPIVHSTATSAEAQAAATRFEQAKHREKEEH